MNLEDKISKYLDGELSEEEDTILRSEISSDPIAREKFDASVGLHLAMREDADSIYPPEDLLRETEDVVLMKILSQQPIIKEGPLVNRRVLVLAVFLLLFMFGAAIRLGDYSLLNFLNKQTISSTVPGLPHNVLPGEPSIVRSNDKPMASLAHAGGSGRVVRTVSSNNSEPLLANSVENVRDNKIDDSENKVDEMSFALPKPVASDLGGGSIGANTSSSKTMVAAPAPPVVSEPASPLIAKDSKGNGQNKESAKTVLLNENHKKATVLAAPSANITAFANMPMENGQNGSEIRINSFFGTDVLRNGIEANNKIQISHFSQSVDYAVNKKERLGIEFGYTEYSYEENVTFKKPLTGDLVDRVLIVNTPAYPGFNEPGWINYDASISRQKQMFWGSAFYERTFIATNIFSLDGRLGVGSSDEGPLGYGRFYGMIEVFDGFAFTVGAEGRVFVARIPVLVNSAEKFKSTASVIYGIQFKF
ncbi:MAG: hypothetical protein WCT77_14270 [Bacteroidota bacterium]